MLKELSNKALGLISLMWREVMKFGVVGGAAFIIDTAIFLWLIHGPMSESEVKAKIVAGAVATLFSWVANRFWTFRHRRQASVGRELLMFLLMNAIGLGIQAGCVAVAKYLLGFDDKTSLFIAGSVIGLVLGTIFRFFAYRFWVFTAELDAEPAFAHDHELLHAQRGPATGAIPQTPGPRTGAVPQTAAPHTGALPQVGTD